MNAMEAVRIAVGTGSAASLPTGSVDLGALAWLQGELRRALQTAVRAMRRAAKDVEALAGSDVGALDPAVLRAARSHLHQSAGALELVGLPAAARLLYAAETLVQRWTVHPAQLTAAGAALVERASFALLDYVARLLAGIEVSPLALFAHYRAVQEAAGAERVHPADLWIVDWRWLELPDDGSAGAPPPGAAVRHLLEEQLLVLMKSVAGSTPFEQASRRMSLLCAQLGAHVQAAGDRPHGATLWKLAAAVFEAQALGLLRPDVYGKRVASRLLQQFRVSERGDAAVDERLAQDLLFFCAQSAAVDEAAAPRLAAARRGYGIETAEPVDYASSGLGRVDPALVAQACKRVAAAKESWAAVVAGDSQRHGPLMEQFALVGDSLQRLLGTADALGAMLHSVAAGLRDQPAAPGVELAMEVATSLLYLEAALEDPEFDPSTDGERGRMLRLAERVDIARTGSAGPLEPWMEALYRRVSDRHTIGSVVHELRTSLAESEKLIDRYFRHPEDASALQPVQAQLQSMRGVLSVLGLDQASNAVRRMRADLDRVLPAHGGASDPALRTELFGRLAGNLGALGFLIDLFGVQPQMAKSMFAFDTEHGLLEPVTGRAGQGAWSQLPGTETGDDPVGVDAAPAPAAAAADDDLHSVFLDEAGDVLGDAREALSAMAHEPGDMARLGALRRAFHTLKGSARMVGLIAFGDAAAQVEELCNRQLDRDEAVDAPLLRCCERSVEALARWIDALAHGRPASAAEGEARTALAALKAGRAAASPPSDRGSPGIDPHTAPPDDAGGPALPPGFPPGVPSAAELDLSWPPGLPAVDVPAWLRPDAGTPAFPDFPAPRAGAPSARDDAPPLAGNDDPLPPPVGEVLDWPVDFEIELSLDGGPGWGDDLATSPAPHWVLPPEGTPPPSAPPWSAAPPAHGGRTAAPAAAAGPGTGTDATGATGTAAADADDAPGAGTDMVRVGPLRIGQPLFNIYVGEAGAVARRLEAALTAWADEPARPLGEETIALAHSLAGCSATVGFTALSQFARALEEALIDARAAGHGRPDDVRLFMRVVRQARQLVRRFAEGFLDAPPAALVDELAARQAQPAHRHARRRGDRAAPSVAPDVQAPSSDAVPPAADGAACAARADTAPGIGLSAPVPIGRTAGTGTAADADADAGPATGPGAAAASVAPQAGTAREAASAAGQPAAGPRALPFGVPEFRPLAPWAVDAARAYSARADTTDLDDEEIDAVDAVDAVDSQLFPIFEEEGRDLLPQLAASLREWARRPADTLPAAAAMRTLHTLKGSARLAGALRLGDLCHRLETRIERLLARSPLDEREVEALQTRLDALALAFDAVRESAGAAQEPAAVPARAADDERRAGSAAAPVGGDSSWMHFAPLGATTAAPADGAAAGPSTVRVRTPLLDRLVSRAGEVSIARTRIETDMQRIKGSLADLSDNFARLRQQLRDLELLAEIGVGSRSEAVRPAHEFDPLELDRYTSFQELSKMMSESANDVLTVQRTLQRAVEGAEDTLAAQGRLTRDMQDDLLRTRMVEFESQSERLYRVVRQTAKETGKQVRLDIYGGSIEIDRGLLDRMTPVFEHLLRNCVVHGIEPPPVRAAAGKEPAGAIVVALEHVGNEVAIEFRDDGAGLDLERIRARGVEVGLVDADAAPGDAELAALIFRPGFSTVGHVTELAGRGVGMDVVYSEVNAVGGRIETATAAGQGTSFRLLMPLTTAVTQIVLLRAGALTVAVPATLIEVVSRVTPDALDRAYAGGSIEHAGDALPFHWLGALLQGSAVGERQAGEGARPRVLVVVRSARQRVALHVDEMLGKHEAVVKNLGPQLARVPGLVGITLLATGEVALIYNPVALAARHGEAARARTRKALAEPPPPPGAAAPSAAPLVLVVDDSITVRRVTKRLLEREGYRVALAKDGVDALEHLAAERPRVVLSDIEMPRMDGFELVRRIRADARLAGLPLIVITSRSARKHRALADELGVDHYLGKPYAEEDLLALVARHAAVEPA